MSKPEISVFGIIGKEAAFSFSADLVVISFLKKTVTLVNLMQDHNL